MSKNGDDDSILPNVSGGRKKSNIDQTYPQDNYPQGNRHYASGNEHDDEEEEKEEEEFNVSAKTAKASEQEFEVDRKLDSHDLQKILEWMFSSQAMWGIVTAGVTLACAAPYMAAKGGMPIAKKAFNPVTTIDKILREAGHEDSNFGKAVKKEFFHTMGKCIKEAKGSQKDLWSACQDLNAGNPQHYLAKEQLNNAWQKNIAGKNMSKKPANALKKIAKGLDVSVYKEIAENMEYEAQSAPDGLVMEFDDDQLSSDFFSDSDFDSLSEYSQSEEYNDGISRPEENQSLTQSIFIHDRVESNDLPYSFTGENGLEQQFFDMSNSVDYSSNLTKTETPSYQNFQNTQVGYDLVTQQEMIQPQSQTIEQEHNQQNTHNRNGGGGIKGGN